MHDPATTSSGEVLEREPSSVGLVADAPLDPVGCSERGRLLRLLCAVVPDAVEAKQGVRLWSRGAVAEGIVAIRRVSPHMHRDTARPPRPSPRPSDWSPALRHATPTALAMSRYVPHWDVRGHATNTGFDEALTPAGVGSRMRGVAPIRPSPQSLSERTRLIGHLRRPT